MEELTPDVLRLHESVPLAAEATRTLTSFGDTVVDALSDALLDSKLSLKIRRKIPVVLMHIGTRRAQQALMESMLQADTSLRFRIIAALNKLQRDHPELPVDHQTIEMILAAEILGHYRSYQIMGKLDEALKGGSTIGATLNLSLDQEVERIFRLLGLRYPDHDFHSAYFGLQSKNSQLRANALELLDNILSPRLRDLLIPLVDRQVSMAERTQLANRVVGASVDNQEQAIEALLVSDIPWLRATAVHAIGALEMYDLEARLEAALEDVDSDVQQTARLAKQRLAEAREALEQREVSEAEGAMESAESMGVG
jgi:AAA family ATP:ADP antiporter